jgi:hypothetical protein
MIDLHTSSQETMLWGDKRFHTWNYEMREQFGGKVFKVMLDAGFTAQTATGQLLRAAVHSAALAAQAILPAADVMTSLRSSITYAIASIRSGPMPSTSATSKLIRIHMRP